MHETGHAGDHPEGREPNDWSREEEQNVPLLTLNFLLLLTLNTQHLTLNYLIVTRYLKVSFASPPQEARFHLTHLTFDGEGCTAV